MMVVRISTRRAKSLKFHRQRIALFLPLIDQLVEAASGNRSRKGFRRKLCIPGADSLSETDRYRIGDPPVPLSITP